MFHQKKSYLANCIGNAPTVPLLLGQNFELKDHHTTFRPWKQKSDPGKKKLRGKISRRDAFWGWTF